MMDNERRADIGQDVVLAGAEETGVDSQESTETAITDVLSYIAHFCERCGLDPKLVFQSGLESWEGDAEDGPPARPTVDPEAFMNEYA